MKTERIADKNFAHIGDPCRFCGQAHDDVSPGPCPNIVAYRPPLMGEWFIGARGTIEQARLDFAVIKCSILGRYPQ